MDGAGIKAPRLLRRKVGKFIIAKSIPADTSGAYWPGPQAKTESFPGIFPPLFLLYPPVTEGYLLHQKDLALAHKKRAKGLNKEIIPTIKRLKEMGRVKKIEKL